MTEKGDPYENAIAERVNGILKEEFALDKDFDSFEQAKIAVENAISIYNQLRPYSIYMLYEQKLSKIAQRMSKELPRLFYQTIVNQSINLHSSEYKKT